MTSLLYSCLHKHDQPIKNTNYIKNVFENVHTKQGQHIGYMYMFLSFNVSFLPLFCSSEAFISTYVSTIPCFFFDSFWFVFLFKEISSSFIFRFFTCHFQSDKWKQVLKSVYLEHFNDFFFFSNWFMEKSINKLNKLKINEWNGHGHCPLDKIKYRKNQTSKNQIQKKQWSNHRK